MKDNEKNVYDDILSEIKNVKKDNEIKYHIAEIIFAHVGKENFSFNFNKKLFELFDEYVKFIDFRILFLIIKYENLQKYYYFLEQYFPDNIMVDEFKQYIKYNEPNSKNIDHYINVFNNLYSTMNEIKINKQIELNKYKPGEFKPKYYYDLTVKEFEKNNS